MPENMGRRIKVARARADWTQARLAQRVGVAIATVSRWESDEVVPRLDEVERMAQALTVPVQYLVSGGPLPPIETKRRSK